jgi:hypothetical protein
MAAGRRSARAIDDIHGRLTNMWANAMAAAARAIPANTSTK